MAWRAFLERTVAPIPISVLTCLKELNVAEENTDLWFPGSHCQDTEPHGVLQHCSRLTYLKVGVPGNRWQHISCLVDLQELYLSTLSHITRSTLPGGLPTSLRVLRCSIDVLDPMLLSTSTNMQRLTISGQDRHRFCLERGAPGDALLRAIAQLQQLEDLHLSTLACNWPPMSSDHPALTASSSLTKLRLRSCTLPSWEHVLSPGRMLQSITIEGSYPVSQLAGAVKQLVVCCPKLQDLHLYCRLGPTVDVTVLGQLSALTALHANYRSISDVGEACQILQQLACLTRLADLHSSFSCATLEVSALVPFTALRRLTHLKCTCYSTSTGRVTRGDNYNLVSVLSKTPS